MTENEHEPDILKKVSLKAISQAVEQRARQERLLDEGPSLPLNANPLYAESGPIYGYGELVGEIGKRISQTSDEKQVDATLIHYRNTQELLSQDPNPESDQLRLERAISQQTFQLGKKKVELSSSRVRSESIQSAILGYIPGVS